MARQCRLLKNTGWEFDGNERLMGNSDKNWIIKDECKKDALFKKHPFLLLLFCIVIEVTLNIDHWSSFVSAAGSQIR